MAESDRHDAIDVARLQECVTLLGAAMPRMLASFAQTQQALEQTLQHPGDTAMSTAQLAAHKLRSNALTIGARSVAQLCGEIEHAESLDQVEHWLAELERHGDYFMQQAEQLLAAHGVSPEA